MIDEEQRQPHWASTVALAKKSVAIILAICLISVFFTGVMDNVTLLGFPAGFYYAAQAAPLILAAVAFWFVRRQDAIDRQYGASDEL